jgi:monoterpene epsilon-lactone hydrolase
MPAMLQQFGREGKGRARMAVMHGRHRGPRSAGDNPRRGSRARQRPAVSPGALERLIGCELFRRSTHRVELTLAGDALLDHARTVLADVDVAISRTQAVGGELVGRGNRLWQPVIELSEAGAGLEDLRAAFETMHAQFAPPPEVGVRPVNARGVPSLLLEPQPTRPATLLYLHGGGHVLGSAFGYRPLAGALALASERSALVPDFRLAPEHPFPAALDDVLHAYRWMINRGAAPRHITVAGDSSGGALAMSLLLRLKQEDMPLPGAVVLLCPGLDLAAEPQPQFSVQPGQEVQRIADAYLGGHPLDDPLVSPLLADLTGLPPLLIQAATGDDRLDDARRLAARASDHGVDARLELYPVATHVFQVFWSFLPEASEALEQAGAFASRTVAAA